MREPNTQDLSRRAFLARSVAGLAVAGLPEWFVNEAKAARREAASSRQRRFGPNDQINVACIGPGGSKGGFRRGLDDTRDAAGHPGVKVVAVCDVDKQHRD